MNRDPLQRVIERVELCTYAIKEAHLEMEAPHNPEHKADLLLAVEGLTYEAIDLLRTTKLYVWGRDHEQDEEDDFED